MITFRTSMEISDDRRVVLTLPPNTPVGEAELVIMVAPKEERVATRGDVRRYFGAVRGGNAQSADNDLIDADLARAYGGFDD
jgi:hypothetical protein